MPINTLQGEWVKFICGYTKSQDPRVRTAAYNAMVNIFLHCMVCFFIHLKIIMFFFLVTITC